MRSGGNEYCSDLYCNFAPFNLKCFLQLMNPMDKLHGILSLSAASIAFLQSAVFTKGESLAPSVDLSKTLNIKNSQKTDRLILAPAYKEQLLKLYVSHASHASHASHSSHYSGSGDYSSPSDASTDSVPSTPPVTQPPSPRPRPVRPASKTDSVAQTNVLSVTNAPNSKETVTNELSVAILQKRASEGSADAQLSLALCYLYGTDGIKQNREKAKALLELSVVQGNASAKSHLDQIEQDEKEMQKLKK